MLFSCDSKTKTATLNLFVESGGYGAISVTLTEVVDENIDEFLSTMQDLTSLPLHCCLNPGFMEMKK